MILRFKSIAILLPALLLLPAGRAACQVVPGQDADRAHNETTNIRFGSASSTRLLYNSTTEIGEAGISYSGASGDFHPIDSPSSSRGPSIRLSGLHDLGRLKLGGFMNYTNLTEQDGKWNSSLGLDPENPFFVADSIGGKSGTESFRMAASGALELNSRLTLGASIGLTASHLSDNTDPRPRINLSVIPVNVGVDWHISPSTTAGLFAGFELKNSRMTYTVVSSGVSHQYFVMKGLGDYFRSSSLSESGYNRSVSGNKVEAGLNFEKRGRGWSSFTEVMGSVRKEDSFSEQEKFRAGDFSVAEASFSERLWFDGRAGVRHDISINGKFRFGSGWWYEQQKRIDAEHGSTIWYEIMSRDRIHTVTVLGVSAGYNAVFKNFRAGASAGYDSESTVHYNDDGAHRQEVKMMSFSVSALHEGLRLGKANLKAGGSLRASLPAGDEVFDGACNYTGKANIDRIYAEPLYAYRMTGRWGYNVVADLSIPLLLNSSKVLPGIFVSSGCLFSLKSSAKWTVIEAGTYLNF